MTNFFTKSAAGAKLTAIADKINKEGLLQHKSLKIYFTTLKAYSNPMESTKTNPIVDFMSKVIPRAMYAALKRK